THPRQAQGGLLRKHARGIATMNFHLLSENEFWSATADWRADLETLPSVGHILDCIEHCMIAATFNTFEAPAAQRLFEKKILPGAVLAVMTRSDVVDEQQVASFLQHMVQFFLRTVERDNEELLDALRAVLIFRLPDERQIRARGTVPNDMIVEPYEFYQNHGIDHQDEVYPVLEQHPFLRCHLAGSLYDGFRGEGSSLGSRFRGRGEGRGESAKRLHVVKGTGRDAEGGHSGTEDAKNSGSRRGHGQMMKGGENRDGSQMLPSKGEGKVGMVTLRLEEPVRAGKRGRG
ncbi:unnamed protein product, partial [Choristocarpus tenellus]